MASEWSATSGAFNVSTLREPYRIEGKKTLGLELAVQLGWSFPDAIIYPTGGGTGLIGMWKAFGELLASGWVTGTLPPDVHGAIERVCAGGARLRRGQRPGRAMEGPRDDCQRAPGARAPGETA